MDQVDWGQGRGVWDDLLRAALACVHSHVKQLVRSCSMAQEPQLKSCDGPEGGISDGGEGGPTGGCICIHIADSLEKYPDGKVEGRRRKG